MNTLKSYNEIIDDYKKNIIINTFFNENGKDIKELMQEIILSNCNPMERKKLEL